MQIKARSCPAA